MSAFFSALGPPTMVYDVISESANQVDGPRFGRLQFHALYKECEGMEGIEFSGMRSVTEFLQELHFYTKRHKWQNITFDENFWKSDEERFRS